MILPVYTYNHEILRKPTEEVTDFNLTSLVDNMFQTMYNADGVGVAAPQIGISKKIIVIDCKNTKSILKGTFINPKILKYSSETSYSFEGCLSFPGLTQRIKRPFSIEIEWYDIHEKYNKESFSGFESIVLQHEIDHLNETLFIDKAHPDDRMLSFMKLEKIKQKQFKPLYPII